MKSKIFKTILNIAYPLVIYLIINLGIALIIRALRLDFGAENLITILAVQQVCSLFVVYLIYRYQDRKSGLANRQPFREFGIINLLMVCLTTFFILIGISIITMAFRLNESFPNYSELIDKITSGPVLLQFLSIVILAPMLEEVLCRGIIYNRMREISNFFISALVSSLIWSVAHMNIVQGITAFLFGFYLAYLYEKYRSLWVTIISHSFFNFVPMLLGYFVRRIVS